MASTIAVDSNLEIYTTLFGWQQYGIIWDILLESGLAFVPFLGILMRNFLEPLQSASTGSAGFTSLKRMEIEFFSALIVVILAGQPAVDLQISELVFPKICVDSSKKTEAVTEANDDSIFKESTLRLGADGNRIDRVKVPIWWFAVLAVSSGINNAARHSLPCVDDARLSLYQFKSLGVKDIELQSDIIVFMEDCYLPTRSFDEYARTKIDGKRWNQPKYDAMVQEFTSRFGGGDKGAANARAFLKWMGSPLYLQMDNPFFYQGRFARAPGGGNANKKIRCDKWWLTGDSNFSNLVPLRTRLLNDVFPDKRMQSSFVTQSKKDVSSGLSGLGSDEILDYFLMDVLSEVKKPTQVPLFNQQLSPNNSSHGYFSRGFGTQILGFLGSMFKFLIQYPTVIIIREGATAGQAFILMALYALLPIGLVFSSYSIQYLVLGAAGIFTVKFLGYIFHVAFWVDQHMLQTITFTGQVTTRVDGQDPLSGAAMYISMKLLALSMYTVIPIFFFTVMGWAGITVAQGMQSAFNNVAGASSVGAEAGGEVAAPASRLIKSGSSLASGMTGKGLRAAGRGGKKAGSWVLSKLRGG